MALIGPILDDRSYEQLRDELVRRIPVYAPKWTDHNASDPGIALLELFAYLGESLLYRFNQIPDATKVAFLRLLAVRPRPAQVAGTLLVLRTERPAGVQVLRGTEARAGAVAFETADEVYAWPLEAYAVGKTKAPDPPGDDPARANAEFRRRQDAVARLATPGSGTAAAPPSFYVVSATPADPLDNDQPALDVSATLDGHLWVALLGTATTDATQLAERTLFLGVLMDEQIQPAPFDLEARTPGDPTRLRAEDLVTDPPPVLWELWNGPGTSGYTPLTAVADTTRGLTTTGVVKLALPAGFTALAQPVTTSGDAASPPPLDDPKLSARVVAWLRAGRPATARERIHRVRWVGLNAVAAVQSRSAAPELLGIGTADAGQTYRLTQRPVLSGTVALEVEEAGGWQPWTEVDTLAASGPSDRHFTVDLDAGLVHFGTLSRVPQIGERVRVTSYRYGGGAAGNVGAATVTALSGVASVKVTNLVPATGGADAVSLADALEAIPAEVARRDRAVTAEDFRGLAEQVPGVRRAETLPLLHPDTPTQPAAGVVSVVIFPDADRRAPAAPQPDLGLLRRVAAYLNPRRLLTTELYVIPPTYRPIAVSVGVHVQDGYQVDAVRRWVELILRQYLAPVPPYGPAGAGWPLGRAVRRAELEAVAVQVDGVEYVEDELALARLQDGLWAPAPLVTLQPWEVPELRAITVVGGSPLPVGEGYGPAAPGGSLPGGGVFVPLPPEVC